MVKELKDLCGLVLGVLCFLFVLLLFLKSSGEKLKDEQGRDN